MKLEIQHQTESRTAPDRRTVLFGVSDFQIENETDLTLFFPPSSGLNSAATEVSLTGTVTSAVEESTMDDLTYTESVIESIDSDAVIVVESRDFPRLQRIIDDLPTDARAQLTRIKQRDSATMLGPLHGTDNPTNGDSNPA